MSKITTHIGTPTSETKVLKMRGKDTLTEIVGEHSFTETFYFIVTGRMPTPSQTKCLDACLTVLMDHGITPNALVARLVHDSVPEDLQVPIAAGILMVGSKYVGTMAGVGRLLNEGLAKGGDPRAWAAETVARFRENKRHIPGFGHPYYRPTDPRAVRLFEVAEQAAVAGRHIELLEILGEEIDKAAGRHLTLNVTGAMGALLCEIEFPVEVMRAVAIIGRAGGLVAHIHEEKSNNVTRKVVDFVNSEVEYEDPA